MSKKSDEQSKADKGVDLGRRSVAKAGLAAPVIMTLVSKPVLANQCSHSGMMSGNTSNPNEVTCEGCTPGFWKTHPNIWPDGYLTGECLVSHGNGGGNIDNNGASPCNGGYDDAGTKFGGVFGNCRGSLDLETMMNLLVKVNGFWTLHAHAIAALFNAIVLGSSFGQSEQDVLDWWCNPNISDEDLKNRYAMLNERSCPLPY